VQTDNKKKLIHALRLGGFALKLAKKSCHTWEQRCWKAQWYKDLHGRPLPHLSLIRIEPRSDSTTDTSIRCATLCYDVNCYNTGTISHDRRGSGTGWFFSPNLLVFPSAVVAVLHAMIEPGYGHDMIRKVCGVVLHANLDGFV